MLLTSPGFALHSFQVLIFLKHAWFLAWLLKCKSLIRNAAAHVPAQSGSVTHRRGRGHYRGAPVHLDEGPLGLGELVEVGLEQCWALSVR